MTAVTKAPAQPQQLARSVIELRGVGVSYRGQRRPDLALGTDASPRWGRPARHRQSWRPAAALSRIDLTVAAGELVTLTGPAGAGLSTLLSVIGLLLRPTTGSYLLNDIDTARLGDRDRAALRGRALGLVLQPARLLPARSALDNVMLPLLYAGQPGQPGRARRNTAMDCLDRVELAGRAQLPAGALSAGERQRVAIARALVTGPALLLLDDPTANLDTAGSAQVIALLTSLNADGTTIVVGSRDQLAAAYSSRCASIASMRISWPAALAGQETSTGAEIEPGGVR